MVVPLAIASMNRCRGPDREGDGDGIGCAAAVRVDDVGRPGGVDRRGGSGDMSRCVVDREPIRQGWRPDLDQFLAFEGGC